MSHYATVARASAAKNTGCIPGAYQTKAGITENNSHNQETTDKKNLSLTCLSVLSLLILIKKLKISFLSLGL